MSMTISTYKLKQYIGLKKSLAELGVTSNNSEPCLGVKNPFPEYIEPFLTLPLEGKDTKIDNYPRIVLISATGATGKTAMTKHLSSVLNIPVFDLGKAREVASNSLTGSLVKEYGVTFSTYLEALKKGDQAIIIDALDEGLAKSGTGAFNAFIDDVLSLIADSSRDSIPVIMLGRTQAIETISEYLESKKFTYSCLQISPFTLKQANDYVDMKVKPNTKFKSAYTDLKNYIFSAIGSYVKKQSELEDNFLGYAPVLDAISTAIRSRDNYQALLEEYKKTSTSGISFILNVIEEIIRREKEDKINEFLLEIQNDLTEDEYNHAKKITYDGLEQCKALLTILYDEKYHFSISSDAHLNTKFSEHMSSFIEDHPFLNGKSFENTVFESYVLTCLMIEDPDNIYLRLYLAERYRDAYMLFYFLVELIKDQPLKWHYIQYVYRSLISFDKRNDYGHTWILQNGDTRNHSVVMFRQKDNKRLELQSELDEECKLYPGNILSNMTIDSQIIDLCLDAKSVEIVPPILAICNYVNVGSDIVINELQSAEEENVDSRVIFECLIFNVDFQSGHRPEVKINSDKIQLTINSENKLIPPFSEYGTEIQIGGSFSKEFVAAFVKLRKILITFRSHSKGSMARYKGKIDDSRISGHDIGKLLINSLLENGIIEDKGYMYHLNRSRTAELLGLTFDKLQATSPTPQMAKFIKRIIDEK